jgi:cell division protein FtsL
MATAVAVRTAADTDVTTSRPRRRIARSRKRSGLRIACTIAAAVALTILYVGMYAQVTRAGYHRAALMSELRKQQLENESLRIEVQNLTGPERLATAAQEAGMLPGTESSFVRVPKAVSVARADQ